MSHRRSSDLRDPEAFSAVYRRLAPSAHAAALAVLRDAEAAQDVVQDVFCAIWTRPDAYRPERGSLSTFVQLMARSRALDRLRSGPRRPPRCNRGALEARAQPATAEPPSETVIRRDSARECCASSTTCRTASAPPCCCTTSAG